MFDHLRGRDQCDGYDDRLTREGCRLWLQRVIAYYGDDRGDVDIGIIDGQLPLSADTADYLYRDFTPAPSYRRGSRPMLERIVDELVAPGMSDRDKALVLLRRCRDNPAFGANLPDRGVFCGGSEEELVKRGAIMCNEISRLFCVLAQIAGLPARVFSSHMTGHMMNEVLVDGRWWWLDVMFGIYCFDDDDQPASAWQLFRDPGLFNRQRRASFADWSDRFLPGPFPRSHPRCRELNLAYRIARYRDCYFHPKEAVALGNYGIADFDRLRYPWHVDGVDPAGEAVARHKLAKVMWDLGWPPYYFDFKLFDEPLQTRD